MKKSLKKRVEGVISIMLAFLMLPFISVAGVVVESGRYQNASTLLSEAVGSASYSTLANYDNYLLERFGLLGTDQAQPISDVFSGYLNDNLNLVNENGFSNMTVDADGIYPLTDPDILYYQICEMDKLLSPTTFALEGLNIKDLIKELESHLHLASVFKIFSSGAEVLGNGADTVTDLETLEDIAKELEEFKTTKLPDAYNAFANALQNYNTAVESYKTAKDNTATAKSNLDTANENYEKAKSELGDLEGIGETIGDIVELTEESGAVSDAETALDEANSAEEDAKNQQDQAHSQLVSARDSYVGTLRDYASKLEEYAATVTSYNQHKTNCAKSIQNLKSNSLGLMQDVHYDKAMENLDKNSSQYADLAFEQNINKMFCNATADGTKDMMDNLNEAVSDHIEDNMDPPIEKMRDTADKLAAVELGESGSTISISADSYQVNGPETVSSNKIAIALQSEMDRIQNCGILDFIKAAVSVFNTIFHFKGIIDWNLNATVDKDYFSTYGAGLSTLNLQEATVNRADQAAAELINYEINNETAPSGLTSYESASMSALEKLAMDIAAFIDAIDGFVHPTGLGAWLRSGGAIFTQLGAVGTDFVNVVAEGSANLLTMSYDRLMYDQYLVGMLPNRLNYKSGKAMNGYSFSNIAYTQSAEYPNIPVLGGLAALIDQANRTDTGANTMFCGAELEYLLNGAASEYANQAKTALWLYLERLVIDVPSIIADETPQALIKVPIAGWIAVALIVLAEPLLDVILLFNGADVPLIKDNIYFSPMGIAQFINTVTGLKNSSYLDEVADLKSEMSIAAEKWTGVRLDTKDVSVGHSFGSTGFKSYLTKLFSLNYQQHIVILMFLFGNDRQYSRRLADIIQMEAESQFTQGKRSTHFDLGRSYTFVRAEVKGAVNQIMPIPGLANNSRLPARVLQYRGY